MTQLIIVILSLLTTLFILYLLSIVLEYTFNLMLEKMFLQEEELGMLNILIVIIINATITISYFAINNTFLHFKY